MLPEPLQGLQFSQSLPFAPVPEQELQETDLFTFIFLLYFF